MFSFFFLICVLLGSKFCSSLLDNIAFRVPTSDVRNYNHLFASCKNCPSTRRASFANLICCDIDVFCKDIKSLRDIMKLPPFR